MSIIGSPSDRSLLLEDERSIANRLANEEV